MSALTKLGVALCVLGAFFLGLYWPEQSTDVSKEPTAERAAHAPHETPIPSVATPSPVPKHPRQTDALYDRFVAYLVRGEWVAAVNLYDSVYSGFDESLSWRFHHQLLDTASASMSNAPRQSVALLTAYTEIYFQDVAALRLLADGLVRLGEPEPALQSLQEAYLAAHQPADLAQIQAQIDSLLRQYAQLLAAQQDYQGLVRLYQTLLDQRPDHAPYYLRLAEAHLQNGNPADARRALRYIQYDSELGDQARQQITRLDNAAPRYEADHELTVPMTRVGNNFVVPVRINNIPVRLLLDTGASVTVLTPVSATRIGTERQARGVVNLETANGRIRAPLASIRRFEIGDDSLSGLRVAIIDLGVLGGVDGLLGMDVLSRYRVIIDREHAVLRLER